MGARPRVLYMNMCIYACLRTGTDPSQGHCRIQAHTACLTVRAEQHRSCVQTHKKQQINLSHVTCSCLEKEKKWGFV